MGELAIGSHGLGMIWISTHIRCGNRHLEAQITRSGHLVRSRTQARLAAVNLTPPLEAGAAPILVVKMGRSGSAIDR